MCTKHANVLKTVKMKDFDLLLLNFQFHDVYKTKRHNNATHYKDRLSNHLDFVGINHDIPIENPKSRPTCYRDRKNPGFDSVKLSACNNTYITQTRNIEYILL